MIVIGLAGKTGSGKNLLAQALEERGFYHYDLDKYVHRGIEACSDQILSTFGSEVNEKGSINRPALGQIVFHNQEERMKLQEILYPWLENFLDEDMKGRERVILNGALLSESNLQLMCKVVFWIEANPLIRLIRIIKRDRNRSFLNLIRRMKSQSFLSTQLFSEKVDIEIIRNHGKPETAIKQLMDSLDKLIQ